MKKFLSFLLLIVIFAAFGACTENQQAKNWGGTATINVPAGQKVINATWKESDFWYLTRPMYPDEKADTLTFHEESSFGVWKGTYILYETK